LQGFIAFLPFGLITLKSQRPKPYNPSPTTLGEHLRKRRIELGLFQKDVAERLGINEWTYLGWEHKGVTPPVTFWPRVIGFLGHDPTPESNTIGEQIAARRRALGIDHRQAAKIVGVDDGTLLRYERDEWKPKGDRLQRIIEFVG